MGGIPCSNPRVTPSWQQVSSPCQLLSFPSPFAPDTPTPDCSRTSPEPVSTHSYQHRHTQTQGHVVSSKGSFYTLREVLSVAPRARRTSRLPSSQKFACILHFQVPPEPLKQSRYKHIHPHVPLLAQHAELLHLPGPGMCFVYDSFSSGKYQRHVSVLQAPWVTGTLLIRR